MVSSHRAASQALNQATPASYSPQEEIHIDWGPFTGPPGFKTLFPSVLRQDVSILGMEKKAYCL